MLPSQCLTCGPDLEPPAHLREWLNIKFAFEEVTGKSRQTGMAGMLRDLQMELQGRHHSGIDDCRNIGAIAMRLLRTPGGPEAVKASNRWKGWTKKQTKKRRAMLGEYGPEYNRKVQAERRASKAKEEAAAAGAAAAPTAASAPASAGAAGAGGEALATGTPGAVAPASVA